MTRDFVILDLVIIVLATAYISIIVSKDRISGPFNVLNKLRYFVGVRWDEYGNPVTVDGSIADMIMCQYCNSIWIGLIITAIYYLCGSAAPWLLAPLAAGGFISIVATFGPFG